MKVQNVIPALCLATVVSCASKPVDVTVSIVPRPTSVCQFEGTSCPKQTKTVIDTTLGREEYILDTRKNTVKITAGSPAGEFYALKTLGQLKLQADSKGGIAKLLISDKPEFAYRGAHLDCCRHFFSISDVKVFVDMMTMHKLNTFHWHLTDDQGWRFESKKYPALQEVAAWRNGTMIQKRFDTNDGIRHGGFYTQEEMKEIVEYCKERFITVIPEIEMPGHATAALAAYPVLGCTGGPYEVITKWGIFPDIFCAGNDQTIRFLQDILDEVCEVFPSEYIHIGGDEAPKARWKVCPKCQARMKELGLKKEAELQSWLTKNIEDYLASKGRKIIGWDEILEGGISQSATVMSWRGPKGGKAAAKMGNDVIMTPNIYFYFDYYQTADPKANGEPFCIGGHVNLAKVYSFNPYEDLDDNAKSHIKGIQANLWGEYIPEFSGVLYRELPRIAALCEIAWNASGRTDYADFVERIKTALLPQYEAKGWPYADFAFRNPPVE